MWRMFWPLFDDFGGLSNDSSSAEDTDFEDSHDSIGYVHDSDSEEDRVFAVDRFLPKFVGRTMFEQLRSLRCSEELTDVTVKVGGETFRCHKIILSAWCPYFRGLFASGMMESQKGMVELSTLEPEDFSTLVDIMYSGEISIDSENVEGLIFAACYLQSKPVQEACTDFMIQNLSKVTPELTFSYLKICRVLDLEETAQTILNHMLRWFEHHMECSDFADLSIQDIEYIAASENLQAKITEDELCYSVLTWFSVGLQDRKKHLKKIIFSLRYLALSESFMKNTFLDHPVLAELDHTDQMRIRTECNNYLRDRSVQDEVIGQPEASHRAGSHLKDMVVAMYRSKFICFAPKSVGHSSCFRQDFYELPMPKELLQQVRPIETITACNYGRSEMYVSTGSSFFHFNGITGNWKKCACSVIQKSNNCLVLDSKMDTIYSVTSNLEGVFIEKYSISHSSRPSWQIVICGAYSMNKKAMQEAQNCIAEKYQSWAKVNRTCAYIVNQNIFVLHSTDMYQWNKTNTSVLSYNTDLQTLSYVTCLPMVGTCIMAVRWSNLVFLVDQDCRNVLRVSNDGMTVDLYGEIGHDNQSTETNRRSFGASYWDGKLIISGGEAGGYLYADRNYILYDLDSHCTSTIPWSEEGHRPGSCHSIKMTIDVRKLKYY